ncbi:hypothetical protein EJB05_37862, partial [Eragrostis curvula]
LLFLNTAPALDRFQLAITGGAHDDETVDGWIRCAVTRCPSVLDIHSEYHKIRYALPAMDYSRYFGRLRTLRLHNVELDVRFAAKLESGCPVLEDVELEACLVTAPALAYLSCKGSAVVLHDRPAFLVEAWISLREWEHVDIKRKVLGSWPVQRDKPTPKGFRVDVFIVERPEEQNFHPEQGVEAFQLSEVGFFEDQVLLRI